MKTKVISILTRLTMMAFFTAYLTGCDDPVEKVSSVSLDKTTLALKEGENETLKATVLPAGADNKKITWKSSDSNIASVDQTGKVTAVKAGSAKVTVTTEDGGKTASCAVTVTAEPKEDVAVTGVTIAPSEDTNLKVESTLEVTAMVSPVNAKDRDVTWSGYNADATPPVGSIKASDDDAKEIASYTMDTDGKLTVTGVALGAGILTVTTKNGNHSDTLKITVVAKTDATIAVTAVTLDPSADFNLQKDLGVNLMATVEPDNATDKTLTWTSGDEAIVTVDNGVVTGVAVGGPIEIIVTSNSDQSIADTLKVTVNASVPVTGVTVDPEEKTDLKVDETFEVMAMVEPFGSLQTVTWSDYDADATPPAGSIKASDDDAKVIATYTMGTDGKLTVTGKAVGAGTLTVTTTDGGKTDNLNITVVAATTNVAVEGVTITAIPVGDLKVNSTLEVTAEVSPANATNNTVTWSDYDADATPPAGSIKASDDDAKVIATYTMGTDGKLTVTGKAVGAGTLTVRTTDGSKTADLNITVVAAAPTVTISVLQDASTTLTAVGATLQLSASAEPVVDGATFVWFSSDDEVAIVDHTTGLVTAVSHGTATITARYVDPPKEYVTKYIDITVDIPVTGVTITKHDEAAIDVDPYYLGVDSTLAVMAMVSPEGADETVTWSGYDATATPVGSIKDSNDDAIVIATYAMDDMDDMDDGVITITGVATGAGTLTVRTTDGNYSATLNITVATVTIVHSVTATQPNGLTSSYDLTATAPALHLFYRFNPISATVTSDDLEWSSSDENVATVDADGKVSAVGSGTAKITAMYNGITSNEIEVMVPTVTISHSDGQVSDATLTAVDATLALSASVDPVITNPTIEWSSSDTNVATVSVDETTGVVTVSRVTYGRAKITATYNGITSNEIEVTLLPTNTITITATPSTRITSSSGGISLAARLEPVDANVVIKWSSSDENVATVVVSLDGTTASVLRPSANGVNGTATITATAYDKMTPPAEIITIPKATIEITVDVQ